MDLVAEILSWVTIITGSFFVVTGGVGILRLPDFFTRLHAVSMPDTLGIGLIVAGLVLQAGFTQTSAKLIMIFLFMLFTGPAATHALAKAALHGKLKPLASRKDSQEEPSP